MMINRHTSHQWEAAYSAKSALEMVSERHREQRQYDVIFIDINMPEVDGVQFTRTMKEMEERGQLDLSNT